MTEEAQEKTFTQQDFDSFKSELETKHQEDMNALAGKLRAEFKEKEAKAKADAEKAAKQANMSELEKANAELEELKAKYQEKEDIIALSAQKDETRKFMSELGVDEKCLDFVFIPKDIEGTKTRAKAFKEYIDNVKKETFETNLKSKIPGAGSKADADDAGLRKAMGLKA
ncbi:MAG: DUF4355 domain-containing protein [Clostridium sp.]|nr:DUF4355 domain-containing protein [Clostridium sp.]